MIEKNIQFQFSDKTFCGYYHAFYFGKNDLIIYPIPVYFTFAERQIFSKNKKVFKHENDEKALKYVPPPFPSDILLDSDFICGKKAWGLFYEHAYIKNITDSFYSHYPEEFDLKQFKKAISSTDDEFVLQLVRNTPDVLHEKPVRDRFIKCLKDSRRTKGNDLIVDYFLPKTTKKFFSERYKMSLTIIIKLSSYLSDECKTYMKDGLKDDDLKFLDLRLWAQKNHKYRISGLKDDDLKLLVEKPAEYAKQALKKATGISYKTASRS